MSEEPESLVLQSLRGIRADIARLDGKIDDVKLELRSEINSLRADVASDFISVRAEMAAMRKETQEQISGLRRAVIEYHSSVVGHGILISEV